VQSHQAARTGEEVQTFTDAPGVIVTRALLILVLHRCHFTRLVALDKQEFPLGGGLRILVSCILLNLGFTHHIKGAWKHCV
jgi:hypothetical protein